MVEYAEQNFTMVSKLPIISGGGLSGVAHKQPLASVSKSLYRH